MVCGEGAGGICVLLVSLVCGGVAAQEEAALLVPEEPQWWVPTLHATGVVVGSRVALSVMWSEAFDPLEFERNRSQLATSWSSPPSWDADAAAFEWDGDPWVINVVGHGLMGSEFYLRYRQHGHGPWASAGLTAAWSTGWEYAVEGWHKQPSGLDLVWTPVAGLALGELRFWLYRASQQVSSPGGRLALAWLIDPFGQLERSLLGVPY